MYQSMGYSSVKHYVIFKIDRRCNMQVGIFTYGSTSVVRSSY